MGRCVCVCVNVFTAYAVYQSNWVSNEYLLSIYYIRPIRQQQKVIGNLTAKMRAGVAFQTTFFFIYPRFPIFLAFQRVQQQVQRRQVPGRKIKKKHSEFFLLMFVQRFKAAHHMGINKSVLSLWPPNATQATRGYTIDIRAKNHRKFHHCVNAPIHQDTNSFTVKIT